MSNNIGQKHLLLVLPYLVMVSLQTRNKLQQTLKGILNYCKLETTFKCQKRLSNFSHYKDPVSKDFIFFVAYKFECALCNMSNHQITVLFLIIYSTIIFYPLLTTSVS